MSRPTVQELDQQLKDLVNWERLAIHLPQITTSDIEIIKQNKPFDVNAQKQALFDKWLRSYPNASWDAVVLALETIDENTLAQTIQHHQQQQQQQHRVSGYCVHRVIKYTHLNMYYLT